MKVLEQLPAGSVHCVVTSTPYFGLRDYEGQPEQFGAEDQWWTGEVQGGMCSGSSQTA
ncbi:hypothetical protein [Nakamurella panacisegetis]|uniref:hypothetical protein n=1 Tax=Nakamurella panacisegetis TaxID=1090615 RepID=UPI0018D4047E|nr:hypothetical protein [Nakamurella panacisegetis]